MIGVKKGGIDYLKQLRLTPGKLAALYNTRFRLSISDLREFVKVNSELQKTVC